MNQQHIFCVIQSHPRRGRIGFKMLLTPNGSKTVQRQSTSGGLAEPLLKDEIEMTDLTHVQRNER